MKWLARQRIRYALRHYRISRKVWAEVMRSTRVFKGLSAVERAHLREMTTLFLHRKTLTGVKGFNVSVEVSITIAAQACLPILKLGLDYYDGWSEVVIYPGAFRVARNTIDAAGVVSNQEQILSGESWSRGPVILSWSDISSEQDISRRGHNVVIHEFAHKLDMLNGRANGMPPLHTDMIRQQWTRSFSHAYEHLKQQLAHHHRPSINSYGASNEAEFFAVASGYFFTYPQALCRLSSPVYEQLKLFYRQDPANRL
ncbi:MAG: zinc-dependent peptidase [Pseudomonadales bacterium]|nr:zinc-dependent peptidase [Pseudomonadales bacterium]